MSEESIVSRLAGLISPNRNRSTSTSVVGTSVGDVDVDPLGQDFGIPTDPAGDPATLDRTSATLDRTSTRVDRTSARNRDRISRNDRNDRNDRNRDDSDDDDVGWMYCLCQECGEGCGVCGVRLGCHMRVRNLLLGVGGICGECGGCDNTLPNLHNIKNSLLHISMKKTCCKEQKANRDLRQRL